ncbi:Rhodanese-like protein [Basidiobolus meristosporus CBS 931.73]|uniref:M-phase inducer phosphatase n=1 Tax=Basidiobolus meristosporus CBS 931.73 TaxID=1314790 RepID=A0A1Y1ZDI5_9FUNG|nr:Rhodanese-like protein [Basidiobolus meristosporus CBS 931.73]|eukprot:ORY07875.1 Rhodanese-like protein [Basidiobolus meristosporus CBS 931.73]
MPKPPPAKLRKTSSLLSLSNQEFLFQDTYKHAVLDTRGQLNSLPYFNSKDDTLKRITPQTLSEVLSGKFRDAYDKLEVVDCRFPYEYEGGHIEGALNLNTKEDLEKHFFVNIPTSTRTIVIFHCEYSAQRGPRMALYLRNKDRELNIENYPNLYFPELYIVDGGYRKFYEEFRDFCTPQNYIEMNDNEYLEECKILMSRFCNNFSQRRNKPKGASWPRETHSYRHTSLLTNRRIHAIPARRTELHRGSLLNRLRSN